MASISTHSKRFYPDRNTDYKPNEVIHIDISPEQCALLNGKDSYLRCTVKLDGSNLCKLDPFAGGHSIIDYVQIYSGDGGTLLEELTQYSMWNGVNMYYNTSEGLRNKRALLEGQDQDTLRPSIQNAYSMYYTTPVGNGAAAGSFREVELCLPFYNSGILYGEKSFPVVATQGLQVRIYLNSAERAIVFPNVPGLVVKRDRTAGLPDITDLAYKPAFAQPAGRGNDNLNGPIGRTLDLKTTLAIGNVTAVKVSINGALVSPALNIPANSADNVPCVPQNITASGANYCGITAGMNLAVVNSAGAIVDCGAISKFEDNGGQGEFTVGVTAFTAAANAGSRVFAYIPASGDSVDFTVSNVEFFASCIDPDEGFYAAMQKSMAQEGGMSFDIMSFNVTRNNLQKTSTVQDELLALSARRARAILQTTFVPIASPFRSYFRPVPDYLRSYQYVIHEMRVPQLPVDTDREYTLGITNFNPLADDERNKTLESSKVSVKFEEAPANCFTIGRRLATRGHSFNANADHVRTTVSYGINEEVGGSQRLVTAQNDKLLVTFCRHFRKIRCTPTVVAVEF